VRLSKPLIVLSAYRGPEHKRAGGAKASKHLEGIAFDIALANYDPEAFEAAGRAVGFKEFGFHPRSGFVDLGPARSWGERFPKRDMRSHSRSKHHPHMRSWPTAAR
jgi:zinc D-Ala-D-Ala carboxypeptidase